jgi:hypothetical protein
MTFTQALAELRTLFPFPLEENCGSLQLAFETIV